LSVTKPIVLLLSAVGIYNLFSKLLSNTSDSRSDKHLSQIPFNLLSKYQVRVSEINQNSTTLSIRNYYRLKSVLKGSGGLSGKMAHLCPIGLSG